MRLNFKSKSWNRCAGSFRQPWKSLSWWTTWAWKRSNRRKKRSCKPSWSWSKKRPISHRLQPVIVLTTVSRSNQATNLSSFRSEVRENFNKTCETFSEIINSFFWNFFRYTVLYYFVLLSINVYCIKKKANKQTASTDIRIPIIKLQFLLFF